jgi:MFS family permease
MTQKFSSSLLPFIIIWSGQLVSTIGSTMSTFAFNIWVWEFSSKVTSLALVDFFTLLPSIFFAPITGVIVDRCNRKLLMILGDTVTVILTSIIILLYFTNNLQVWHLYISGAIAGTFNQIQWIAYSASISLFVPQQHYVRANSMDFVSGYGANIVAPALAGYLYYSIGLGGMALIDIVTFLIAIISILFIEIPQTQVNEAESQNHSNIWQEFGFGIRYIKARKGLLALLIAGLLFCLPYDICDLLYTPMILSRTGNNTVVLGGMASAAGFGGVIGAIIVGRWGGFTRRIKGVLLGMTGIGLSKTLLGFSQIPRVWMLSQFLASLHSPLNGSSNTAIWMAKVHPNFQGRVFAARSLIEQLTSAFAYLITGLLADRIFEPAMKSGSLLTFLFAKTFGTGTGAGISVLYVICALCMSLVGLCGYRFRSLRNVEET